MSRLLARIQHSITDAPDAVSQARARLQLALYCIRKGDGAAAIGIADQIRQDGRLAQQADLAVELNLVEAALLFYAGQAEQAIHQAMDKARRAHAIGLALRKDDLACASAAWLAWFSFELRREADTVAFAATALRHASPAQGFGRACACLVVADAFGLTGRTDLARLWFAAARSTALLEGDELMLGAVMVHSAGAGLLALRLQALAGAACPAARGQLELELESAVNYGSGIKSDAMVWLLPAWRAQLLTVRRGYQEACVLFGHWIPQVPDGARSGLRLGLRADHAWCLVNNGQQPEARAELEYIEDQLSTLRAPDDMALIHARLRAVAEALNDAERSRRYRALADDSLALHQEAQQGFEARLRAEFGAAGPQSCAYLQSGSN